MENDNERESDYQHKEKMQKCQKEVNPLIKRTAVSKSRNHMQYVSHLDDRPRA